MYTPFTHRGERYRQVGYWFATGHWYAQPRDAWTPDRSSDFADFCAERADEYSAGQVTYLASIPDLWDRFQREVVWAPPDPDTALSFDQCEAAGLDGTLRSM